MSLSCQRLRIKKRTTIQWSQHVLVARESLIFQSAEILRFLWVTAAFSLSSCAWRASTSISFASKTRWSITARTNNCQWSCSGPFVFISTSANRCLVGHLCGWRHLQMTFSGHFLSFYSFCADKWLKPPGRLENSVRLRLERMYICLLFR